MEVSEKINNYDNEKDRFELNVMNKLKVQVVVGRIMILKCNYI